jgi:hypothetical protein
LTKRGLLVDAEVRQLIETHRMIAVDPPA